MAHQGDDSVADLEKPVLQRSARHNRPRVRQRSDRNTKDTPRPRLNRHLEQGFRLQLERGVLREEEMVSLLQSGTYPSRNPAQNMADLKAQIAANEKGAQELRNMVEQYGLAYSPTNAETVIFIIMVVVLAVRPQGLLGRPA